MVERPPALLIDLFYTLVAYDGVPGLSPRDRAKMLNIPFESYQSLWRRHARERYRGELTLQQTLEDTCKEFNGDSAAIPAVIENVMARHRRVLMNPREDILTALRSLREMGLRLALISNIAVEEAVIFDESPLKPLFDTTVLSSQVGLIKPDPEIYLIACRTLGVIPEHCWFVGDGGSDELIGARGLGMKTVFVKGFLPLHEQEEHFAQNPDFVIDHLPELVSLLEKRQGDRD